jgi:uncharacterized membrane protein YidH (DUF202 family)
METDERQEPEETHPHLPELKQYSNYLLWKQAQFSNERKFLNWIQIAIAVITVGFFVNRLGLSDSSESIFANLGITTSAVISFWMPLTFFILGGIIILVATGEYYLDRRRINQIQAESTTRLDVLIISVLTLLLVIATVFMLVGL